MQTNHHRMAPRLRFAAWRMILLILLCPLAERVRATIPLPPGGSGPTNILLGSWSFTDITNWTSDHGYAPLSFTNLNVSDLGDGTALVVDSPEPAWLQYNVVESNGTTNLALGQGSVMFWFAPNWSGTNAGGTGPGVSSRLIEAGSYTEDASYGWWGLYVDPAGANLYFSGQSNDGSQATYLSAPIEWTTNRWHLIALTYSSTNSALYIDGALATNGTPVTYLPGPAAMTNGFYVGSASNGTAQAHGMFDGLVTYANPLDAGSIAATYWYGFVIYDLNPMNRANLSSAPSYPTNTDVFAAIAGPGYLQDLGAVTDCVTSSNVWITNVVAVLQTNWTMNVAFTIAGGSNGLPYDVFATSALKYPITNAVWTWMGQGYHCNRYAITNLPGPGAFLILGTPLYLNCGLTEAYELLVAKVNPEGAQTDSYGVPYAWYAENGLVPITAGLATQDPDYDGLLNWQEYMWGTKPTVSEGFEVWASTPNGTTSIP